MKSNFIQVVSNVVPKTRKVFDALNIPFGLVLTPNLQMTLPRVQFPVGAIVRCLSCNSYLSLYSSVDYSSKNWKCAICSYENNFPDNYFPSLHPNRIEISAQNYEIYAEEKYMERAPMCPCFLFILDISDQNNSFFQSAVINIQNSLKRLLNEERTLVGFLLFGQNVHIVRNSPEFQVIQYPGSLSNPWLPLPPDHLLFNFFEDHLKLFNILEKIKTFPLEPSGKAFKKALKISQLILENNGGKILCFLNNPVQESEHPKKLTFLPTNDFYHKLSEELVDSLISVDLFMAGNKFCGFFTYCEMSRRTGGESFYYKNFEESQNDCFQSNLDRVLLSEKAWEAVVRLRVSTEWKLYNHYGHFSAKKDLLHIPCYQNLSLTFDLAPKLFENSDNFVTFQASLLFTSSEGIRIIRVMNFQVMADDNIDEILKSINCETLVNLYLKHAVGLAFKRSMILAVGKFLETKTTEVLKVCLVAFGKMPLNLQDFTVRMLGLTRHELFSASHIPCRSK
jgi:protein transport protein SEC24